MPARTWLKEVDPYEKMLRRQRKNPSSVSYVCYDKRPDIPPIYELLSGDQKAEKVRRGGWKIVDPVARLSWWIPG